jgi:hypothetical protein
MMDTFNETIDDLKIKRLFQGERKHGPLNLERTPETSFKRQSKS